MCYTMRHFRCWRGLAGDFGEVMVSVHRGWEKRKGRKGADWCASGHHIESDTGNVLVCDSDGQWR